MIIINKKDKFLKFLSNEEFDYIDNICSILCIIFGYKIIDYNFKNHNKFKNYDLIDYLKSLIEDDLILLNNIDIYNSYEKIGWETFIKIIKLKIPNLNELKFGLLFEKCISKNDHCLYHRLNYDFHLSKIYENHLTKNKTPQL